MHLWLLLLLFVSRALAPALEAQPAGGAPYAALAEDGDSSDQSAPAPLDCDPSGDEEDELLPPSYRATHSPSFHRAIRYARFDLVVRSQWGPRGLLRPPCA